MDGVRDTSLLNYTQLNNDGTLDRREKEIYDLLEYESDLTDWEICYKLGYKDRNQISPARWRLAEKRNLIKDNGKRKCSQTKRMAYQWRIK